MKSRALVMTIIRSSRSIKVICVNLKVKTNKILQENHEYNKKFGFILLLCRRVLHQIIIRFVVTIHSHIFIRIHTNKG